MQQHHALAMPQQLPHITILARIWVHSVFRATSVRYFYRLQTVLGWVIFGLTA
jgi:hypothetical protein